MQSFLGRHVVARILFRGVFHRLLTEDTPLGVKARAGAHSATPLIRVKSAHLEGAGVVRVPRVADGLNGKPLLEDGRVLDVANIIWCTGFEPDFRWIKFPVFDANGDPKQRRGVATNESGLYFVGLAFLYAMSSSMIHGVGRDAKYVARAVAERLRATARAA